jgi:hypothetical protein
MSTVRRGSPSGPEALRKLTTIALTYATIATNSGATVTAAVAGLRTTDMVTLNPTAALPTGVAIGSAWPSAAGVMSVQLVNGTAALVTAGAATVNVGIEKYTT